MQTHFFSPDFSLIIPVSNYDLDSVILNRDNFI